MRSYSIVDVMISQDETKQTTFAEHGITKTKSAVAIDIETINLTPEPDFQNPAAWEPFAIAIAYRSNTGDIDSEVIIKTDRSPCEELRMYDKVVDWIEDRNPEILMTYNGTSYDIPIMQHRAWHEVRECPDRVETAARLDDLIHELDHKDLMGYVRRNRGYRVSLEQELEDRGIDYEKPRYDGKLVQGSDMPDWGRRITSADTDEEQAALLKVIRRYAESDVVPLFELYDGFNSGTMR